MTRIKRTAMATAALMLIAAGCGDDSGDTTSTPATNAPATTGAAPTTTAAQTTTTTRAATVTTGGATATTAAATGTPVQCGTTDISSAANKAEYTLTGALKIEGPTALKAGANGITVKVSGGQHELKILKGNVASQPRKANNAVDESKLAAGAMVFKSNVSGTGPGCTGLVTLPAGAYTFVCNVEQGPNSHAGGGQIIDVTVA